MTVENVAMGEQPIFSTKAHVFHIDPTTKKSWIPASSTAVSVSFFFDSTRNLYRIISVEGTKAVINSTITPSMTFTKTSQKFGQWSDVRANTVYGLGFASEADLNKFIEKFQEVKEATKSAQKCQPNGTAVSTPVTSASASPVNVRSSHAHIRAPSPAPAPALSPRLLEDAGTIQGPHLDDVYSGTVVPPPNSSLPNDVMNANTLKTSLVAHQRSQSLSGLQQQMDSPKHQGKTVEKGSSGQGPAQSPVPPNLVGANLEAQLKYENDRLKLALAQSSANAKKWEVELQTLKNNNARLTSALQESTANVEEWKRQLQAYKDENARMKIMILELEASKGNVDAAVELKKELHALRLKVETLETDVREKEVETHRLAKLLQDSRSQQHMVGHHNKYDESVKNLQLENESLKNSLSSLQRQLDATVAAQEAGRRLAETLHSQLGEKLNEIMELHGDIANALST